MRTADAPHKETFTLLDSRPAADLVPVGAIGDLLGDVDGGDGHVSLLFAFRLLNDDHDSVAG